MCVGFLELLPLGLHYNSTLPKVLILTSIFLEHQRVVSVDVSSGEAKNASESVRPDDRAP